MKTSLVLLLLVLLVQPDFVLARNDGKHGNPHTMDELEKPRPDVKNKHRQINESKAPSARISIGISQGDARELARETGYATGYSKPLPPGMRNRLAKGKALPPGIARKQVPPTMLSRLPVHPGHEWLVIGVDLVLVNIQTRVLLEILPRVF